MTTQRDRLAAVLHTDDTGGACWHAGTAKLCEMRADKLLARGVRVVDAETLATAFRGVRVALYNYSKLGGLEADNDAATILAALDAAE